MNIMQTALDALHTVGPYALAVALLLASMGVPVPVALMLLASGAWVREGRFSAPLVFACCIAGATSGNFLSYQMGKHGLKGFVDRFKKHKSWRKAEKTFHEKGALGIFLTRWLLTPLALPANLIAGGERFPLPKFLAACVAGEVLWVSAYGGLGYAFAGSWRTVAAQAAKFSGWIGAAIALYIAYRVFLYWREKQAEKAAGVVAEAEPAA